jgi:Domain of unknown function (DUF151)
VSEPPIDMLAFGSGLGPHPDEVKIVAPAGSVILFNSADLWHSGTLNYSPAPRLGEVVGVATAEGEASCCVVLDGVSENRYLPIQIGQTEAFNLSATLAGEEFARPMSPQFAAGLLHALAGGSARCGLTG